MSYQDQIVIDAILRNHFDSFLVLLRHERFRCGHLWI